MDEKDKHIKELEILSAKVLARIEELKDVIAHKGTPLWNVENPDHSVKHEREICPICQKNKRRTGTLY